MLKPIVLLGMLMLSVMVGPAHAMVSYTFSGPGGLDGTLLLDDSAPFVITVAPGSGTGATLDSPLNFISGRIGAFTFFGRPELQIFQDQRQPEPFFRVNVWIVDSPVVGPPVGNVVPTRIRFGYDGRTPVTISLTPPPASGRPGDDFFFGMFLSNGSLDGCCSEPVTIVGPVFVPEPAVAVLLVLGLATVLIFKKQKPRDRNA
jgi:hypothetical protein